ncbi:HNH endonuclease [Pseudomonas frederiksbergensis]|uniref:HNH endonuclease n=1 Tax=Pseudomonas frederiksbergensis TaxID=104087 RepID=UPI003D2265F7
MADGSGFGSNVKQRLREAVGFHCSAPFCNAQTNTYNHSRGKQQFTGEAAHIYGLRGGTENRAGSARYDDLPQDLDPNSYGNGIWLCRVCHRMVDQNPELFRGEDLLLWKEAAEYAHNESGRRRSLVPIGVDMKHEYEKAKDFIKQLFPLGEFMHDISFYSVYRDQLTPPESIPSPVVFAIREAGCKNSRRWNAEHPHWTFLPDFQAWKTEIVRRAEILASMDGISIARNQSVSFYNYIDGDEIVYDHPTARSMQSLKRLLERFNDFLRVYQGPYPGMVSYHTQKF